MNDVLEHRLADLFDRVGAAVEVDEDLERAIGGAGLERRAARPYRRPLLTAAAVLAAVTATGTLAVVGGRSEPGRGSSTVPAADPGPLYLLPADAPGWTAQNGSRSSGPPPGEVYLIVTVATPVGDVFIDPVVVTFSTDPPVGFSDDTWRAVSVEGGPAFVSPESETSAHPTLVQQRGDVWLSTTSDDRIHGMHIDAFEALELGESRVTVRPDSSTDIIAVDEVSAASESHSVYFELVGPIDEHVVVETLSSGPSPVAFAAERASHVEQRDVDGTAGWHGDGTDVDGPWHSLAWEVWPRQVVVMSGHVELETLLALAEDLEVVDEATWEAATGAA